MIIGAVIWLPLGPDKPEIPITGLYIHINIYMYIYIDVLQLYAMCMYHIVGYFWGGNFSWIRLFKLFERENFHKSSKALNFSDLMSLWVFEGKLFTNGNWFVKFFSLKNDLLYSNSTSKFLLYVSICISKVMLFDNFKELFADFKRFCRTVIWCLLKRFFQIFCIIHDYWLQPFLL